MGTQSEILGLIDYWGGIPSALQNNGASVYITNVNGMDSKATRRHPGRLRFSISLLFPVKQR
jgi:hypothetical protein